MIDIPAAALYAVDGIGLKSAQEHQVTMNKIFRRQRSRSPAVPSKARLPRQKAVDDMAPESVDVVRLEVPTNTRVRSSSFDSSSLHEGEPLSDSLQVPSSERRKKSRGLEYSYSGGSTSDENVSDKESYSRLGLPKYFRRKSLEIPRLCIHCVHLEALQAQDSSPYPSPTPINMSLYRGESGESTYRGYLSDSESEDDSNEEEEEEENVDEEDASEDEGHSSSCVIMTPRSHDYSSRSSSIGNTSGSSFKWDSSEIQMSIEEIDQGVESCDLKSHLDTKTSVIQRSSPGNTLVYPNRTKAISECDDGDYVETLQVPTPKQRSSSLDAAYFSGQDAERTDSVDMDSLSVELPKHRSSSVDVNLPTTESGSYIAITHGKVDTQ